MKHSLGEQLIHACTYKFCILRFWPHSFTRTKLRFFFTSLSLLFYYFYQFFRSKLTATSELKSTNYVHFRVSVSRADFGHILPHVGTLIYHIGFFSFLFCFVYIFLFFYYFFFGCSLFFMFCLLVYEYTIENYQFDFCSIIFL